MLEACYIMYSKFDNFSIRNMNVNNFLLRHIINDRAYINFELLAVRLLANAS